MTAEALWDLVRLAAVPGIAALVGFTWRAWLRAESAIAAVAEARAHAAEALAAFKLEVAKSYVSVEYLKDVENRLTQHLVRIETKLDERAPRAPAE